MSKYTTQVRFICETAAGLTESKGYSSINSIIAKAIPVIFDFDFPIYDSKYKNVLCTKILKHYYTREIGAETVGLWKLWLDTRLNEIMPYYNQLYRSAMIEFDPMHDIDITTTHKRDIDGSTDITGETDINNSGTDEYITTDVDGSVSRNLYSDTPQGALDNVEDQTYLTNATKNTVENTHDSDSEHNHNSSSSSTNTSKTVATSTEDYLQTVKGKSGGASYSKRLLEYRQTFINIDSMIIADLSDLFMNIY